MTLTRREFFAALCLQAYIGNSVYSETFDRLDEECEKKGVSSSRLIAAIAVEAADALIAELDEVD